MTKAKTSDIEKLSFEEALKNLETIVKKLETGASDLEGSIEAYEQGILLKKHCEAKLKEAQSRIEKITVSKEGAVSTESFALSE